MNTLYVHTYIRTYIRICMHISACIRPEAHSSSPFHLFLCFPLNVLFRFRVSPFVLRPGGCCCSTRSPHFCRFRFFHPLLRRTFGLLLPLPFRELSLIFPAAYFQRRGVESPLGPALLSFAVRRPFGLNPNAYMHAQTESK